MIKPLVLFIFLNLSFAFANSQDTDKIDLQNEKEFKTILSGNWILKSYVDYLYQGENVLSSGNTELFTKDILNLDELL